MLGDLWQAAKQAQEVLQAKCANPDLRVRVVTGDGSGSLWAWRIINKPENRPVEFIHSEPVAGPPPIDRFVDIIYKNDRTRHAADPVLRVSRETDTAREKGLEETNEIVTEGNYEISKALRKEYIIR